MSIMPAVLWSGAALNGSNVLVMGGNLTFNGLQAKNVGQYMCLSILESLNSTVVMRFNVSVLSEFCYYYVCM